jgi:hypothetical protein
VFADYPGGAPISDASPQPKKLNERKQVAVYLEANYSKKLGLPGYSSHQSDLTKISFFTGEQAQIHFRI